MTNITFNRLNGLEIVTLDRPEALNALNSEMIDAISEGILAFDEDPKAVFIEGAGNRAFCAGGDIKAARLGAIAVREGRIGLNSVVDFFVKEYAMNKALFHAQLPTISFMNGITMGGGVGIAGACKYRIATEKTVWAMPEVTIGFFPDVGAAYYLARAPDHVGKYLGLTGNHLESSGDLIKCGFATHYIYSNKKDDLIEALKKREIESVLDQFSESADDYTLPYERISSCFAPSSVEEILSALKKDGSDWAISTRNIIQSKSPTSLKVALKHIEAAKNDSFDEVIARDLKLAAFFLAGDDLIEGVRAAVVDKDKKPMWNPARLEDVGMKQIEDIFNKNLGLVL
ncbi:MAG: 3-hydroxyisobutyryl-CoA hydrolase [Micavibrio aeruginosavorus]|uniref:3-hydroxyisobutyryl-CoA hydrolase n=1 Tax=Micavibrio aeruginosavorus TaxID=349221 RepID=A0A2W5FJZ1_9BACT|nr:MAG: 3-hydroxyisobutyryl-CoA hydrolase [Micavibrio aeruginosavorus]